MFPKAGSSDPLAFRRVPLYTPRMAAPPLLLLTDIHLRFGATPLLAGAELSVGPGERICLVGRNGSGKSTLLKIASGLIEPDAGTRFFQPGTTVRYLQQEPDLSGFATTLAYVEAGLGPGDDPYRALYLLNALGLTGEEDPSRLSGGEQKRAALACALAPQPDLLILDEPTNHLDLPAIQWLESELSSLRSALLLISHDRAFLNTLSRATVWLDRGTTRRLDKGFAHFEAWRDEVFEEEERDSHKRERKIAREEDWLRYGVSARRKRNVRRLGLLYDLRDEHRTARKRTGLVSLSVSEGEVTGKRVVELIKVSKAFGERTIVNDLSLQIVRGDRLALVGPNGAGKTTLLKLMLGEIAPDSGTVKLGTNLEVASLEQKRDSLTPDTTLTEALTRGRGDYVTINGENKHVVGYMKDFLFSPEQARSPLASLSGGERGRLMLARALATPSNVLVLDEPTNDLDLETLDLLQELIADYPGTVILVSHDRDFIDRVASSTLMSEGEGRWTEYAGGYADMLVQRGKGVEARAMAAKAEQKVTPRDDKRTDESKKKMSFKDKHALETLPALMEKLQTEIAANKKALDDPGLYGRDKAKFEKLSLALAEKEEALARTEEQWLELEMLRESLEG